MTELSYLRKEKKVDLNYKVFTTNSKKKIRSKFIIDRNGCNVFSS